MESDSSTTHIRRLFNGHRQGHLVTFQGTSWEGYIYQSDVYISLSQYLAWKHFQERSGQVLPQLPSLLEGCDFEWTLSQRETEYSPAVAVKELIDSFRSSSSSGTTFTILQENEHPNPTDANSSSHSLERRTRQLAPKSDTTTESSEWQHPFASVGAGSSYETIPLTIVASALEIPMIGGTATSSDLDMQPLYHRTIPSNKGDAQAILQYYASIGVTRLVCLYQQDAWGVAYHAMLQQYAHLRHTDMKILSIPFSEGGEEHAMATVKGTGYRFIFVIMTNWELVMEAAYDAGIVGVPEYSWIAAESNFLTFSSFALNRTDYDYVDQSSYDGSLRADKENIPAEYKHKHALQGLGVINLHVETYQPLELAMAETVRDPKLRQDFIDHFHEPELLMEGNLDWYDPDFQLFQNTNYDAVIAMGLAACQTPGLFTGLDLSKTLKQVRFEGTSGNVSFDATTGSRQVDSVLYRIDNLVWAVEDDPEIVRFNATMTALISGGQVHHLAPFVYYDGTSRIPADIPPLTNYDYNLVPVGSHVFALIVAGIVIWFGFFCVVWTTWHRNHTVVKASQPIFLVQLCIGTIIMTSAVIPMSAQGTEESRRLDVACMSIPWMVFIGFVTALAALFSKAWRLNRLIHSGLQMRRIQVQPSDVIWPFAVLITINFGLLLGWSIAAPLRYVRVLDDNNVDTYGRHTSSYGTCQSGNSNANYFLVPIILADFVGVCFATYQSYKGRNFPTDWSESKYLAISMAIIMESMLLGGPLLIMVQDNPTALYVVASVLLCLASMAILAPVFVPKMLVHQEFVSGLRDPSRSARASSTVPQPGSLARSSVPSSLTEQDHLAMTTEANDTDSMLHKPAWGRMNINRNAASSNNSLRLSSAQFRASGARMSHTRSSAPIYSPNGIAGGTV